jgi:hypothetical protein
MMLARKTCYCQDIDGFICIRVMRQCSYFYRAFLVSYEGISLQRFLSSFVTRPEKNFLSPFFFVFVSV